MKYPCSPILSSTGLTDDWKVDVDACDVSVQGSHSGGPTVHKSCEGLKVQHLTLDPHSDVFHQALSTGDMPSETPAGTAVYNDAIETERLGRESSSKIDFALQKPAHAIRLGPSIINHVPMDAQTLEECMVATPTQMEDSLQTHTDQDRCLSGVNPSEGPCCTGLQKLSTQTPAHKWELQTLIRQDRNDTLPVLSPAEESLSDKENEDISEEDVVGSGEHKRPRGERQEQGGVQTPEAKKGQFDWTMPMIPFENLCDSRGKRQIHLFSGESEVSFEFENDYLDEKAQNKMSSGLKLVGSQKEFTPAFSCSRKSFCGSPIPGFTAGKFKTVPIPQLCLSPVSCKKGGRVNPEMNKLLHMESKVLSNLSNPAGRGSGNKSVVAGDILWDGSSSNTQQIAQLELNLSSLKGLISNLESYLSETWIDPLDADTDASAECSCHDQSHSSPVVMNNPTDSDSKQPVITVSEYGRRPVGDNEQPQLHQAMLQDDFRVATGECQDPLLVDTSSKSEQKRTGPKWNESLKGVSMNQSYDVEAPSGLLLQAQLSGGKQCTPCTDGHGVAFHAKRRLVMKAVDRNSSTSPDQSSGIIGKSPSSADKGENPVRSLRIKYKVGHLLFVTKFIVGVQIQGLKKTGCTSFNKTVLSRCKAYWPFS